MSSWWRATKPDPWCICKLADDEMSALDMLVQYSDSSEDGEDEENKKGKSVTSRKRKNSPNNLEEPINKLGKCQKLDR